VNALASRAKYSLSRFCVLYKQFFSVTPIEELLDARIEKARALLEYGHKSVTEVAELCGFSSIHYFSRKFKKKTGVSPSEYNKK
jgi:AraC-like DNA-binding protein